MDRNEVLERLDKSLAVDDKWACIVSNDTLRAAAELIRQSGWRPIAEFADDDEYMTCGAWVNGQWNVTRVMLSKPRAIALGYTHYIPEPEPPAQEVLNERG